MAALFFYRAPINRTAGSNTGHADNVVASVDMSDFAGDA
jgi:hypothetical protein